MLRKASQALYVNEQFNLEEMHNYRMAVTEREVINGCLSVDNVKDHVIIYTRILQVSVCLVTILVLTLFPEHKPAKPEEGLRVH